MRSFLIIILLALLALLSWWVWTYSPEARHQAARTLDKVGIHLDPKLTR
jgi:cbb3-type cytochrome oxidase subunit 3